MIEKKERPLGTGSLSYNHSILSEDVLHFILIANPKRSDTNAIFDTFKYEISKPVSQESIVAILEDLETLFLTKFPDSENYFNKIESTIDHSKPGHQFFSSYEATGIRMTNEYLRRIFACSGEQMKYSVEEMQKSQKSCTIS